MPSKQERSVSTTLVTSEPFVELDVPPIPPHPSHKETKPVTFQSPDPDTVQGEELSLIISLHSRLCNYAESEDEELEEESKPAGDA